MPNYRRIPLEGHPLFVTLVTFRRAPILVERRSELREALLHVRRNHPFRLSAFVLLPEHCHFILELPAGFVDFSVLLNQLKGAFSRRVPDVSEPTTSRRRRRERAVWQRRFWEHVIRDEADLHRHLDYIHYNPVKHGLVPSCADWPWSSFHRFVADGLYEPDWSQEPMASFGDLECTGEVQET